MLAGSTAAACAVVALSVGFATGGGAVGATAPAPASAPTPSSATAVPVVAHPEPVVRGSIIAADGASAGPVTGGTAVTVTGAELGTVASVTFGGNPGTVVGVSPDTVTISTPPATDFTEGAVEVRLFDLSGEPVRVTGPDAASVDPAGAPAAAAAAVSDVLTFNYVQDPRVTAELDYALAHWSDYNSEVYGAISGNDCVNFTSQSLIARGWTMDADWSFDTATRQFSPAWDSSTAFAAYLTAHPERGTALTDQQRNLVKVGDVVQFDWDSSGDRDHTGIVTRVDKTADGVKIYYAGHTANTDYKSVDESLANAGGTVSYWSIH
jgi:Putative amidase domain/IPT/TIG domain